MNGTKRTTWLARLAIAGSLAAVPIGWHVVARDRGDGGPLDGTTTAAIAGEPRGYDSAAPAEITALRAGLDALAAGDVARARAVRDGLAPDALDRKILAWAIVLDGSRDVPGAEIAEAASALAGWPAQAALRRNLERALYREMPGPEAVLAGAQDLWRAWAAAIRGNKNAAALLAAVPEAQRSAGLAFAKARYLRKAGKIREAAAALLAAPAEAAAVVDADGWWQERRALSRALLDLGDAATAYALAAGQSGGSPLTIADAEFHAGWYALRALGNAPKAAGHFARIVDVAEGPMSRSRAFYWLGRAAEEGGPGEADGYYAQAAAYGATFYGQLAAAKLGRRALEIAQPKPTGADALAFNRREAVKVIARLEAAGDDTRADHFYRDLAERLTGPGEVALLAARAEARGNHHLALRIGKIAAGRGIDIGLLAHPLGAIPTGADMAEAGEALAYAVARQESEFNAAAVSRAGARGLLQLLPATARDMAKKRGVDFSADRLTADPGYNATLGAAFLAEQLRRFEGSYVLAIAGYNAGPRRALEWTKRYGDPRGADLDTVVDWIERIPFTETRSYVQRVMENYQVYKMRLSGRFDIAGDLVDGR